MSTADFTSNQLDNLKMAVSKYEGWLKKHEESAKLGVDLLNRAKACAASNANSWASLQDDINKIFAKAYRDSTL